MQMGMIGVQQELGVLQRVMIYGLDFCGVSKVLCIGRLSFRVCFDFRGYLSGLWGINVDCL